MFARGKSKAPPLGASKKQRAARDYKEAQREDDESGDNMPQQEFKFNLDGLRSIDESEACNNNNNNNHEDDDDRQHFLIKLPQTVAPPHSKQFDYINDNTMTSKKRKAKLAKQETLEEEEQFNVKRRRGNEACCFKACCCGNAGCSNMTFNFIKKKRIFIPLIIVCCVAAIYCIPYIEIQPATTKQLPHIPFNYQDGPLRSSSASQFRVEHLFKSQVQGPESVAIDSMGNMYLAIEGGFVLYAHLNKSSPLKRAFYLNGQQPPIPPLAPTQRILNLRDSSAAHYEQQGDNSNAYELLKIAELNGIKQIPFDNKQRKARGEAQSFGGHWQRECLLDEKYYGPELYSGGIGFAPTPNNQQVPNLINAELNELDRTTNKQPFTSHITLSRCSKPLGIRLSPDESYLYVIDTLSGLYRISLKVSDRPNSTQRLVTKLIDFRNNKRQLLPVVQLDSLATPTATTTSQQQTPAAMPIVRAKAYLNISLAAVDDLVIDYGAGTRGGDIIYLSVGSQNWIAVSFLYDLLEGRPSGVLLRYDSGSNQLSVLDPVRVAHVRTSQIDLNNPAPFTSSNLMDSVHARHMNVDETAASVGTTSMYLSSNAAELPYLGIGAPRLDENDLFDDRPLHFPNGLELTDDKSALLVVDTANKRIIKHYISGQRRGTSDLWAWTPNFPDNIRRGFDKRDETYWVVGCSAESSTMISYLHEWPRLRKYILKNIYLIGWIIESVGHYVIGSAGVRDFGYSVKIGHAILEKSCAGMMILQYNKYGDIIRSIYSKEFPDNVIYYSQVNEVIDSINQEHVLYLSSPAYNYVTKIVLPTNSFPNHPL